MYTGYEAATKPNGRLRAGCTAHSSGPGGGSPKPFRAGPPSSGAAARTRAHPRPAAAPGRPFATRRVTRTGCHGAARSRRGATGQLGRVAQRRRDHGAQHPDYLQRSHSPGPSVACDANLALVYFFTHAFVSGLLGVADSDRDGAVSLEEAYRHAYDATLRATSRTFAVRRTPRFSSTYADKSRSCSRGRARAIRIGLSSSSEVGSDSW